MKRAGFTLIELLVVVIIMSVLTAMAVPQYRKTLDRSKAAEAMQVLPALFEARERWVVEHGCTWTGAAGALGCADGETLTVSKLDIDVSAIKRKTADGKSFETNNFMYYLQTTEIPFGGGNQRCVYAVPLWGAKRGLAYSSENTTAAKIYYRGDKFSCKDGTIAGGCAILNVDNGDGTGKCQ